MGSLVDRGCRVGGTVWTFVAANTLGHACFSFCFSSFESFYFEFRALFSLDGVGDDLVFGFGHLSEVGISAEAYSSDSSVSKCIL